MNDASIIIVSYNTRDLLHRCLGSLERAAPGRHLETIVVDNGSLDGTVDLVRRDFPGVRLIANDGNLGFTAANNQALAISSGRFVLFLNPDAELMPDALAVMLAYLEANPRVGVVGPRLSFPDGRIQPSRRRFPTPVTALVESTLVQRWWPRSPILQRFYLRDRSPGEVQEVDWLTGACLLARREAIEAVDGFDERFFMYSEELDLCREIRNHGWSISFLPTARVIHHEGRSSGQNLARRAQTFNESKCRYFEKHYGPGVGRALRLYLLVNTTADLIEESLKLALRHRPELRRERVGNLRRVVWFQWRRLRGESSVRRAKTS
ncbi:MAG: glycosyltransferase family 2 protein [Chloroflexota bacterium]